jgi:antitoxin (DNA-binding transcriptional repressor) of toxin-antitoxin stability system
LAKAREGKSIEITSHRPEVARLVGVARARHSGVARLMATGAAQWAGGKPRGRDPAVPRKDHCGDAAGRSGVILDCDSSALVAEPGTEDVLGMYPPGACACP